MCADSTKAWTWDLALQGIVPPVISSLSRTGTVDGGALTAIVHHVLDGGCSGLFLLGGCGEGAWLTSAQRSAVIRAAARAAGGRAPVLAGVMLPATGPAIEAARQARDDGADALVVGSPYYFSVDPVVQQRHVEAVVEAIPLPALLYNIPQSTHHVFTPATVELLARDPRVLGIKDSAGDFWAFQGFLSVKKRHPAFRVLQGHEHLAAASLLQGADGLVPGLSNFAPALFVALRAAAARSDAVECAKLQEKITDLSSLYTQGHWLPAIKAACALVGLGNGEPSSPFLLATEEHRQAIAAILARHGFIARD